MTPTETDKIYLTAFLLGLGVLVIATLVGGYFHGHMNLPLLLEHLKG